MNPALFFLALPVLTWAGGCCIVSTTTSGVEVFGTSEGTPSEACEGQWTDMACSEFEQTYGVQSIHHATQSPTPTPALPTSSMPPPSDDISDSVTSSNPPTYAPLIIPSSSSLENSTENASDDDAPKLNFRFADISGCGALRSCSLCISKEGCMWSDSGCTRSLGTLKQWCSAEPRADNFKQPCETFTGCNPCTVTAGCVWYRGACSYSNSAACERDPANCVNYAWNCPAEITPVVPWVQPGYGTLPPPIPAYSTVNRVQSLGNYNTQLGAAPTPVNGATTQYTPPFQSFGASSFIMGTSLPLYQPPLGPPSAPLGPQSGPQSGPQQSIGYYPPPPELPSQLAVIAPLVSQANVVAPTDPPSTSLQQQIIQSLLYAVAGPSPPDSGKSAAPSRSSNSNDMSGLYPNAILSSQSTANAPLRSPTPRPTPAPSPKIPNSQRNPETLYSARSDSPPKLSEPLPNRGRSSIIGQYDISPPTPTVLYQPPLIDYDDFDHSTPKPTPKPTPKISPSNFPQPPPQLQQFQPNMYLPTNYAPFQPSQQFGFGTPFPG